MHVIELLLILPFTNAKVERNFSRLNRVKSDARNRVGQTRLETLLRIGEEGESIELFEPDKYIDVWYQDKVRRFSGAKKRKYPKNRSNPGASTSKVATYSLSDLESESDEDDDDVHFDITK